MIIFFLCSNLCDSNFPTGAFSHSYGLESYIQEDIVHDQATFSQWLHVYLNEQLVYSDGLASRLVYEALENGEFEKVWKIDRMLMVQNLPRETREGTQRMGERMLNLVESLYQIPLLSQYRERIKGKAIFWTSGHCIYDDWSSSWSSTDQPRLSIIYILPLSSLVQNAVRAIPLGQTAGQKTIQEFQDALVQGNSENSRLEMKMILELFHQV